MTAAPEIPFGAALPRRRRRRLMTWLVLDRRGRRRYWIEAADADAAGAYLEPGERLIHPDAPAISAERVAAAAAARRRRTT